MKQFAFLLIGMLLFLASPPGVEASEVNFFDIESVSTTDNDIGYVATEVQAEPLFEEYHYVHRKVDRYLGYIVKEKVRNHDFNRYLILYHTYSKINKEALKKFPNEPDCISELRTNDLMRC